MNPVSYPLPSPLPVPLPPTPTNSLLACILLLRIISLCPHGYYPLSQFLFFFFFVIQDAPCSLWCACLVFFRRFLCRWLLFLLANRFISWSLKNLPTSISNVESAWHFKIGIKFFIQPEFHGQLEAVLCRRGINRLFVITVCNVVN